MRKTNLSTINITWVILLSLLIPSYARAAFDVPFFSYSRGGSDQTVADSSLTTINWTTERVSGTNGFSFENGDTFVVQKAGVYRVDLAAYCTNGSGCVAVINGNGGQIAQGGISVGANGSYISTLVGLDPGDELTGSVFNAGGTGLSGNESLTYFQATLVATEDVSTQNIDNPSLNIFLGIYLFLLCFMWVCYFIITSIRR